MAADASSDKSNTTANNANNEENVVVAIVASVIQMGIICVGTYYMTGWLAKLRQQDQERPGNTKAVQRLLEILQRRGQNAKSIGDLNSYEQNMAEDVVDPAQLVVEFKDIGGLDEIKQELWQLAVLPLKRPDLFGDNALVQPPKGILLYGKPGTG